MSHRTLGSTQPGQRAPSAQIGLGFSDPVRDAQATFHSVMIALSEPGTIRATPVPIGSPTAISPAMAAFALALVDFETPVWSDAGEIFEHYLRFHTGAHVLSTPGSAAFAFITKPMAMPHLDAFASGTLEYPDRSTTVVVDVESIETNTGWHLSGPGIDTVRRLAIRPLNGNTEQQVIDRRKKFPCGVDLVFCRGTEIVALPRSTAIRTGG